MLTVMMLMKRGVLQIVLLTLAILLIALGIRVFEGNTDIGGNAGVGAAAIAIGFGALVLGGWVSIRNCRTYNWLYIFVVITGALAVAVTVEFFFPESAPQRYAHVLQIAILVLLPWSSFAAIVSFVLHKRSMEKPGQNDINSAGGPR